MSNAPKKVSEHFSQFPDLPALREVSFPKTFGAGDVMVVFGELFSRGYANGILDEAQKAGMKIIRSTVGRRTNENELRALTPEELSTQPKDFVNIPLEAGFDLDKSSKGQSPCDQLAGVKMSEWDKAKLDWDQVNESREKGTTRFKKQVEAYVAEITKMIPEGKNILFVHTMAGGVPRAKILMPTMNKVFKGRGDRHISSARLAESDIGKLCQMNFFDVTANTFQHLLDGTRDLREKTEKAGNHVSYVAYGYHGTEVLIQNKFTWQTYTSYFQGDAKMQLENYSFEATAKGIHTCVYNCPEILTNSSSIFLGVEVSLYPFLGALQNVVEKNPKAKHAKDVLAKCEALLKPEYKIADVVKYCNNYLTAPVIHEHCDFKKWPQHNSQAQMDLMLDASEHLHDMHRDDKQLITYVLSEEIFKATGHLMFIDSFNPKHPVSWLNHDVLAKVLEMPSTGASKSAQSAEVK